MPIVNIEGVGRVNFPEEMSREDIQRAIETEILPQFPEVQAKVPRGILGGAKDVGASLVSGIGTLAQFPGQVGELIGFSRTGELPTDEKTGLQGLGKKIEEFGEEAKSPTLKAKEQLRARAVQEAEKEGEVSAFLTSIGQTIKDPALLTSFVAEQIPNFIGMYGAGALGRGGARLLMKQATEEAMEKVVGKAGVGSAIGSGAVLQGTDVGYDTYKQVYEELIKQGLSEEEAQTEALNKGRIAALEAAGISIAASRLPGGATVERALAGKGLPTAGGFLRGTLGEAVSEGLEEGGGQFAKNIALAETVPGYELTKGLGQATGMGVLGGALFGAPAATINAVRNQRYQEQQRLIEEAKLKAKESSETQEIPVELINDDGSIEQVVFYVSPDGDVSTDQAQLEEAMKFKAMLPKETKVTEAYADEADRARVEQARWEEARKNSPALQKFEEFKVKADERRRAELERIDAEKAKTSAFATEEPVGGEFRPKSEEEVEAERVKTLAALPFRTVSVETKDGVKLYEGTVNKAGTGVNVVDESGKRLTFLNSQRNVVIDPTEKDIYALETKQFERDLSQINKEMNKAYANLKRSNQEFRNFILQNPIEEEQASDIITGLRKLRRDRKAYRALTDKESKGFFKKDGMSIDDLAKIAYELGYITEEEFTDPTDNNGVRAFSEKVAQLYNNQLVPTIKNQKEFGDYQNLVEAYDNLEKEIERRKETPAETAPVVEEPAQVPAEYDQMRQEEFAQAYDDFLQQNKDRINADLSVIQQEYGDPAQLSDDRKEELRVAISNLNKKYQDEFDAQEGERFEVSTPYADEFIKQAAKLAADVRKALNTMGLKDVGLEFEETMKRRMNGELVGINGSYFDRLIRLSLSGDNIFRTMNHEALHAMRDLGFFSDKDWKVLSDMAEKKWIKQYNIENGYKGKSKEIQIEEAIAHAFADFATQPEQVKSLMSRIVNFLKRIGNVFRGNGFRTAEDVFSEAKMGKFSETETPSQYREMLEIKPVAEPLTDEEIISRQWPDQINNKLFNNRTLKDGTPVMVRLNLNGTVKRGGQDMFLVTVHEPYNKKKDGSYAVGKVGSAIGYDGVVTIRDVEFPINQKARADIASGRDAKSPMGGAQGKIVQGVKNLEGTRLTFNPLREHVFVRVDDGRPVKSVEELTVSNKDAVARGKIEYYTAEDLPAPLDGQPTAANFDGVSPMDVKVERKPIQKKEAPKKEEPKKGQEELFEVTSAKTVRAPMTGVDPAYKQKILNQFTANKATVVEKFKELRPNMYDRLIKGLFDEFRFIKKYSPEAYMKARLSKGIDGALEGLLYYGQVKITDGALDIKPGTKGLVEVYKPLGNEVDQYQIWKALNRDAQMPSDKRSFDDDLVKGRDELVKGELNGKSRKEVYQQVLKEEQAINRSVLDVAKEQGLIDEEAYKIFYNDIYYIPFYKAMEETGDIIAMSAPAKLTGQYFSKALKGGEKKTNDLMENVLMNWSHILSASMKNKAGLDTLKAAEAMGAAEKVKSTYDGKDLVKVRENGKMAYYAVNDPDLVDSISLISYMGPKSAFLDVAKGFTNALRYGVTLSPAYKVRNLIRDSIQSAAVSGDLGKNVLNNVAKGLKLSDRGNPTFISALIGGGVFEMGVAHEGDQAKLIKRLIDKGVSEKTILDTPEKIKGALQQALEWYNEQGNRFENANRLALYDNLRKQGKSHLEASYAARDLMDFSAQGSFRAVKVVSQVVPFFNARLQGLYKLGRDGVTPTYRLIYNMTTGKPVEASDKKKALRFMAVSSAVMLASMLLYMQYRDDEDFQRREDWDRDNFWWFKIGDTIFRVPKPFEIGALGTLAERTLEQMYDESVEGKVFTDRLRSMLADTFSLNPIPQMFKPMIDLYANKDSFTGAPIETAGLQRLSKQERYTDQTSALAKAIGGISEGAAKILSQDFSGLSPVQVDYAIKAYLGWAGSTAASVSDKAVAPFSDIEKPGKPLLDTLAMGFVKTVPETQSKWATAFYENNTRINQAFADMKRYAELGDMDKVAEIYEKKGDLISLQKVYDKTTKQLAEYRRYIQMITNDKSLSKEDKELEIRRVRLLISEAAKLAEDTRKSLKQ